MMRNLAAIGVGLALIAGACSNGVDTEAWDALAAAVPIEYENLADTAAAHQLGDETAAFFTGQRCLLQESLVPVIDQAMIDGDDRDAVLDAEARYDRDLLHLGQWARDAALAGIWLGNHVELEMPDPPPGVWNGQRFFFAYSIDPGAVEADEAGVSAWGDFRRSIFERLTDQALAGDVDDGAAALQGALGTLTSVADWEQEREGVCVNAGHLPSRSG